MNVQYKDSLGLKKGLRCEFYSSVEELEKDAGKAGECLTIANSYLGEKVALVDGRDDFCNRLIEVAKFPMLMNAVTKELKDGTKSTTNVPSETEVKFVNRFRGACVAGQVPGWPTNIDEVETKLQELADKCGPYKADATPGRRAGGGGKLPDYAWKAADQIIANGSQTKWAKNFTNEGVEFEPFTTADLEQNRRNLARAVQAHNLATSGKRYA